ncbi:hypothetical protein HLB23_17105 [Nocardia uniformis]|uniref:Uncharacterized protein n=1 Tax=Nocardia uniformis TaxID=53432 RepID=A0A849BZ40_9NOCA|nr:hypothetical protein [Nocardia uniformis]NNH71564.1 hypothetical protein [Nocardia uniformis]
MSPVDPLSSGVIAPDHSPEVAYAAPDTGAAPPSGPFVDVPLFQLPEDVAPFEAPAFLLSRKEFEQGGGSPLLGGMPHGGPGAPDDSTYAAFDGVLDGGQHTLDSAQHTLDGAQSVLDNARAALGNAPAAIASAQAALASAGPNPSALPPLPPDPVAALMSGMALPAIPGIDALFKPFLDLINSFGTGVLGALNPATVLNQSSKFIEGAMQIGNGALKTVETVWKGKSGGAAQSAGQQAQNHGAETTRRGFDISALTEQAAAVVQRGNIQLTAIAQSFATQATAMAPVALTPPGQAALIASATEHLGAAVAVVNATRGELGGYTAQLSGVVGQLLGQGGGGPNPAEVAQSLAQNVGQPILQQAQELLKSGVDQATRAAGVNPAGTGPGDADTKAAGLGGGAGGGAGVGGGAGGIAAKPGGPGSSIPGGKIAAGAGNPFSSGGLGGPGAGGATPGGFMGAPHGAAAGQRGADQEYSRSVEHYQNPSGESELTSNLGESGPGVIGEIPDEASGENNQEKS